MSVVAICQPNFLPWLGYLEMAERADVFVMLDDVVFIRREWVNRNRILSAKKEGWGWLTVPVRSEWGTTHINAVEIKQGQGFPQKMLESVRHTYSRAPFFSVYFPKLAEILDKPWERLLDLNLATIRFLMDAMLIPDKLVLSSSLGIESKRDDKLADICERLGASVYLANNGSKSYIQPEKFQSRGIGFAFQDYTHPTYEVPGCDFVPYLSAIDALFWHGPAAAGVMRSGRKSSWRDRVEFDPANRGASL